MCEHAEVIFQGFLHAFTAPTSVFRLNERCFASCGTSHKAFAASCVPAVVSSKPVPHDRRRIIPAPKRVTPSCNSLSLREFQLRDHLTAKDISGRSLFAHAIRSRRCQLFDSTLRAVREDVLDTEVTNAKSRMPSLNTSLLGGQSRKVPPVLWTLFLACKIIVCEAQPITLRDSPTSVVETGLILIRTLIRTLTPTLTLALALIHREQ